MTMTLRLSMVLLVGLGVTAASGAAQRGAKPPTATAANPAEATARIVAAAQAVVSTLDEAGKAKVQFPFDGQQKTRWSNLPTGIYERQGLRMGDLTPPQRAAVTTLLQAALSADGYRKVTEIVRGDEILKTSGRGGAPAGRAGTLPAQGDPGGGAPGRRGGRGRGGPGAGLVFGEDEYYLAFVGTPSTTTPWMLQYGGHHLAINLTLAGKLATMAPSLPAAQPATYTFEGKEIRPLGKENDKAFNLINALDEKQRAQAIIGSRVADLVLGPGQDGRAIQPEGLRASAMSTAQQDMLLEIVREWAGIMTDAFAGPRMAEIRTNLPQTWFAWSGPTTNGSAAYFRIQGPTLVIEYAPQGSVDHIHTIYRDPTNDYGAKIAGK
jgi:uncharacterized protein DUF3500